MFGVNKLSLGASTTGGKSAAFRPAMALNFIGSTTLDSKITFTRASDATYFDSTGTLQTASTNVARLDYDPSTLLPRGLLIEEQRTNLLTYSEDFSNAAWVATDATFSVNAVAAPNGATTADKMVESATTGVHAVTQGTITSGVAYVFSVFAKAAERTRLQISGMGAEGQGFFTDYNLSTGTVTGAPTGSQMIAIGNGWYRCTFVITSGSTNGPIIRLRDASGNNSYTGDGTSGLYLWGAQLEAGAFPTSYIPTTTASATRNADAASMTGTNFSSWYNATEGSIFCSFSIPAVGSSGFNGAVCFDDGSINNAMELSMWDAVSDSLRWVGYVSNVSQWSLAPTTYTANTIVNGCGAYKVNSFNTAFNGTLATEDTSGTVPTINRLFIGANRGGGANLLNGWVRRIAYYPRRLSNAQLQSITR